MEINICLSRITLEEKVESQHARETRIFAGGPGPVVQIIQEKLDWKETALIRLKLSLNNATKSFAITFRFRARCRCRWKLATDVASTAACGSRL